MAAPRVGVAVLCMHAYTVRTQTTYIYSQYRQCIRVYVQCYT